MGNRRNFFKTVVLGGITSIVATHKPPAFAKDMGLLKIGQLGRGSHDFVSRFKAPPESLKEKIRCKPYAVWDDYPGVAEGMMKNMGFEKVIKNPVELVKESDVIHIEHADYRKSLELARPALEAGKPVFINRPFTDTISSAEEIIRLARLYNAPLMSASSLEFQPEVSEIKQFVKEKGPVRSYEAYCPEPMFTWMFPHVINFAHAALGGGIDSAYFCGSYIMDLFEIKIENGEWVDPVKGSMGSAVSLLTYKPRNGEPPIIGMNQIGPSPGTYHINIYASGENRNFTAGKRDNRELFMHMFLALNDFYVNRKPPRPYEAILEQHRALVATNVSRLSGNAVRLDRLGGNDAIPYSESLRTLVLRSYI